MTRLLLPLFGAAWTLASAYGLGRLTTGGLPLPAAARLGCGSVVLSSAVLLLASLGAVTRVSLAITGVVAMAAAWRYGRPAQPVPGAGWLVRGLMALFSAVYLPHALAPETRSDALHYHLPLAAETISLGGFSSRVSFHEALPRGIELLFAVGLAFGGPGAAKLIHLGFAYATVPLLAALAVRLGMPAGAGWIGGAIYFCTPVVGVTATSAYNDAALVFFTVLSLFLLLVWKQNESPSRLLLAAASAGFCYAVKPSGGLVAAAAVGFVAWTARRWRPLATAVLGVALTAGPWMARNAALTGNPLAPLFNAWFPNPFFHASTETAWRAWIEHYGAARWRAPWELAAGGEALQGLVGPTVLLLPLALAAVRYSWGRTAASAGCLFALPWVVNAGARFLMPSLPFLWLAFAGAWPRLAPVVAVLQGVTSLPWVVERYAQPGCWCLRAPPWRVALGLETPEAYLRESSADYRLAEFLNRNTGPADSILDFYAAPAFYVRARLIGHWHSAKGAGLAAMMAGAAAGAPLREDQARWPARELTDLRIVAAASAERPWEVHEVRLRSAAGWLKPARPWRVSAEPAGWEAPLAWDGVMATAWRSWEPVRAGMRLEWSSPEPVSCDGLAITGASMPRDFRLTIEGRDAHGRWFDLEPAWGPWFLADHDLRAGAGRTLRRQGVTHVLLNDDAVWQRVSADIERHPHWGLRLVGRLGGLTLFAFPARLDASAVD